MSMKGVFKFYIDKFSLILEPPCVSIISAILDPPRKFADVIAEQKVSCLMSYTTRFKSSKYAFL